MSTIAVGAPGSGTSRAPLSDVSFVVPVRNDVTRLRRCMESIRSSRYDPRRMEIVVVDNGSTDGTGAFAAAQGARVLWAPDARVGELRNRGVEASRSSLIAFVDADHVLDRDWLPCAVETLLRTGAAAVGASYHAPPDGTWVQRMYGALRGLTPGCREVDWLGSGSMLVRRDVFARVGGFNGQLSACEDVELCQRLRAHGERIINDDRLNSVHLGDPETLGALFRGELWRGQNNVAATFRGSFSAKGFASLLVPLVNLVLFAVALGGLLTAWTGGAWLTLVAIGGIAGLAAARTIKMIVQPGGAALRDGPRAFVVALVYHAARALALVVPGSHRWRRRR